MSNNKLGAVVLAAGKGERVNATDQNKVTLKLGGKPIIQYGIELLKKLQIEPIIVVVGFARESVMEVLGDSVVYSIQQERLGSADAVSCALQDLPQDIDSILVINGDDCAFYTTDLIQGLIDKHLSADAEMTFLTIEVDNPNGLGRIVRDKKGYVSAVIEEKDATDVQKQIKEVNPQCFVFKVNFLKKYLPKIEKNKITGEYYLTNIIDIAIKNNERIQDMPIGKILWRGINTKEELLEAEKLLNKAHE